MGRVLAAAVAAALVAGLLLVLPAAADASVAYRPPVPGPVLDPYRPPSTPYGPGNRGLEYATRPGEAVGAPADGEVTFAGPVAGSLHVVVLHADGIRTSLSFLAAVLVRRGQRVAAGQPVGLAAATLHFGARRGEAYLDPASLLAGAPAGRRAILVPDGPVPALGAAAEAAGLRRLLAGDAARSLRAGPPAPPAGFPPSPPDGPPPSAGSPAPGAQAPAAAAPGRSAPAALRAVAIGAPPAVAALALGSAAGRRRRAGGRPGRVARG